MWALFQNPCNYIIVVGLSDLGPVKRAGDEGFVGTEIIDEDLSVDLRRMQRSAAFP